MTYGNLSDDTLKCKLYIE